MANRNNNRVLGLALVAAVASAAWWLSPDDPSQRGAAPVKSAVATKRRYAITPTHRLPEPSPQLLRTSVSVETREAPDRPAEGCATRSHEGCAFLDPDRETLEEMARCGIVRYEVPAVYGDGDGSTPFADDWLANAGVSEAEKAQLDVIVAQEYARHRGQLLALASEAGIDREWAERASPFLLWATLEYELEPEDRGAAATQIARARASEDPTAPGSSLAERTLHIVTQAGDNLERAIAGTLGADRARELRAASDGWPGRRHETASLCPSQEDLEPPVEPFTSSTPEEAQRCIADWKGEGCSYLRPDPLTVKEMARCGVVRYELPYFVMTTDAVPEFAEDWVRAVGLSPTEQALLMEVAETTRAEFYDTLVELAVAGGKTEEWARHSPLLGLLPALVPSDPEVELAIIRQLALERAGAAVTPVDGVDPAVERALRTFAGFADTLESKLAEKLGPRRAAQLRAHDDGWPGNKTQTHSQCE